MSLFKRIVGGVRRAASAARRAVGAALDNAAEVIEAGTARRPPQPVLVPVRDDRNRRMPQR